jgi:RHS repeat-associated protein
VKGGTTQYTENYISGFIYKTTGTAAFSAAADLQSILTEKGRLVKSGSTFNHEYFLKDHLGNTRVVFTDANGNGTIETNTTEIPEYADYYPFGMLHSRATTLADATDNRLLYNGKELQSETFSTDGVAGDETLFDWYDYGARFYDPQIGRFHSIDPWAEIYDFQSPYVYALNNPIVYTDYLGLGAENETNKEERKRKREERREKRELEKNSIDIEPVVCTANRTETSASNEKARKTERRNRRFYRKDAKYLKWLSEGKIRQADKFENWVLRNFSQQEISNLIGNWPFMFSPTGTTGMGPNDRDLVISDEVFTRGAERLNQKLKEKYGDNPNTTTSDAHGVPTGRYKNWHNYQNISGGYADESEDSVILINQKRGDTLYYIRRNGQRHGQRGVANKSEFE